MVNVLFPEPMPGVTVAGLKRAVAPDGSPVVVSVTALLKISPAGVVATTTLKVAAAPAETVWEDGLALTEKSPTGVIPVPLRAVVCGAPTALSATESVAVKLVAEAGVKVTETVQLAPAASDWPQLLLWPKSPELVPATLIP